MLCEDGESSHNKVGLYALSYVALDLITPWA